MTTKTTEPDALAFRHWARELREALKHKTFATRRKALRRCAIEPLAILKREQIERAFDASPIVGTDRGQINVRPTHSGLRDALDEITLMALCVDHMRAKADFVPVALAVHPNTVLAAIEAPMGRAVRSSSTATGFVFGRPKELHSELDAAVTREAIAKRLDLFLADEEDTSTPEPSTTATAGDTHMEPETIETIKGHIATICDATGKTPDELGKALLEGEHDLPLGDPAQIREALRQMNEGADAAGGEAEASADAEPDPYSVPDEDKAKLIDLTLSQAGLPPIAKLVGELNEASKRIKDAEMRAKRAAASAVESVKVEASGALPEGKVLMKPANEVFTVARGKKSFSFEVPTWAWEYEHPHVPEVDENYIFRPSELLRVLYALVKNKRTWLHGHSGTGKTTLVEQVAARLNWPVMRLNFDSEITRMDLIGRDTLKSEGGTTVSEFEDGILPQMLSGPYIGIFDEMDFIRPDVSYVMQRVFEGDGLTLTEDGGRVVTPHPMFRIFATANTVGQGDEHGLYQGARPQSMAMLDRFTAWVHVDYLTEKQTDSLIAKVVPDLAPNLRERLVKYVQEHIEAFKGSKVLQPISPRGYLDMADAMVTFHEFLGDEKKASKEAMEMAVLDKASQQDRVVLKGIIDRVFG